MESNIVFHCALVAATRLRGRERRTRLNFTPGDRAREHQKHGYHRCAHQHCIDRHDDFSFELEAIISGNERQSLIRIKSRKRT